MLTEIAQEAATNLWGFKPGRDIKIVHLTNGMLRTVCGGEPKMPKLLGELAATHAGRAKLSKENKRTADQLLNDDKFEQILLGEQEPERLDDLRVALDAVLQQDGAFYFGSTSTPTLTHWSHLTSDPSDNGAGVLIGQVLLADPGQAAALALRAALLDTSDAMYRLTQPLLPAADNRPMPELPPKPDLDDLLHTSASLRALQAAFQNLAAHAPRLGKLELLARAGRLAGLGLWVHLVNAGATGPRQPLLVCGPQPPPEVRNASHRGIALAQRQLRRNFSAALYAELQKRGEANLTADTYREWAADLEPEPQERYLLEFDQELEAGAEPGRAACWALVTPALRAVGSKTGGADKSFKQLGNRLGLWPRYTGRAGHHLKPGAAIYDALVPALLAPGQTMRFQEFWQKAADEFGLLCGARGSADLTALAQAGMRGLTPAQLALNARSVLQELSRQGYARTYADGEALVGV